MAPVKHAVAVVDAVLVLAHLRVARRKVQLPREAAVVALVGQHPRDQHLILRNPLPILAAAGSPWVAPREESRPAGGANGALRVRAVEHHTLRAQPVQVRRIDALVAGTTQRVIPLLVGADPQDVRAIWHGCSLACAQ